MDIPVNLGNLNNIFAATSLSLLLVSILLNPYYGKLSLNINNRKIRNALMFSVTLFLLTLIIKVFDQVIFR